MKKCMVLVILLTLGAMGAQAQRFALIDMEYILSNVPGYERANEQLELLSRQWQTEVESLQQEAQNLYRAYQADLVFLSAEMKTRRETEIIAKEQEAQELRRRYFGTDGELFKRRESLIRPIQDEVYNAVKEIAERDGYAVVVDRASAMSIIYATPRIDISNEVLTRLGYSN
jgi:outer membrane protein